jgi:dihydroorotate dehydrogenase
MVYNTVVRRVLFARYPDAEDAHHGVMRILSRASRSPRLVAAAGRLKFTHPALAQDLLGLHFAGPIGLAAGLDKQAEALPLLACLFDFVEVGTVLPLEQFGNPRPRVFRVPECASLINRMGFNSAGIVVICDRLLTAGDVGVPLGINVGKLKTTILDDSTTDYLAVVKALDGLAGYFTVNISSPNTPGLRDLQDPDRLATLLTAIREATDTPVLVKLSPDLTPECLKVLLDVIASYAHGVVLGNTSLSRPDLPHPALAEVGGYSGPHLFESTLRNVHQAATQLPRESLIVACGGINAPDRAYAVLEAGADLIQVYTAFIYDGPGLIRRLQRGLLHELHRRGLTHLHQINRRKLAPP